MTVFSSSEPEGIAEKKPHNALDDTPSDSDGNAADDAVVVSLG
jgi:hypothetical protein